MNSVMSNAECSVLTKENFNKAIADLMDDKKWAKRQKEQALKSIEASNIITRCWKLFHDETVPEDIKGLAWGLAMSTVFNGFPICSKKTKDKLEGWL